MDDAEDPFVTSFEDVLLYMAGAMIVIVAGLAASGRIAPPRSLDIVDNQLVFLVSDARILDTNFDGQRLLARTRGSRSEIDQLRLFLSQHFAESDDLLSVSAGDAVTRCQSRDGLLQAEVQGIGDAVRLTIRMVENGEPSSSDIHTLHAIETELETLRANTSAAPFLLWRQNQNGEVIWVNQAYLDTAKRLSGEASEQWPLPVVFPSLCKMAQPVVSESRRISAPRTEDQPDAWYDCHISPVGSDVLFTAIPADEAVRADSRRREFTQTLTKTFAELAIGLAIFDRSRRLVLFNPALLDLTNLATEFLTSRPTLVGFLDQLRENRVMPEPRDYRSWRTAIAQLEAAAADGTYSETWSLPDGQTYHVTGRPHPDGAVALLFEDISAEMSLTRHFRSELEQYQTVIDTFDDAVAMFSPAGEITISNAAYRQLWDINTDDFMVGDLTEAIRRWHELSAPTPIWGDFRDFAQNNVDREEWSATISMRDGRLLSCRFTPQKGGATLASFRLIGRDAASPLQEAI